MGSFIHSLSKHVIEHLSSRKMTSNQIKDPGQFNLQLGGSWENKFKNYTVLVLTEVCTKQPSGREAEIKWGTQLWWEKKTYSRLTPLRPFPWARHRRGTKPHYLLYSHSIIRGSKTSHLKRVISKMPHRRGKLFTNAKLFPHPSGKKSPENAGTKATSPALHPEQPGIQTDRPNAWQQKWTFA